MKNKVFSGIDTLPDGKTSEKLTDGCIILEGGAFRSVYGEGVLDAMMQENINMQCVVGVSAGALNGLNYVAGQIGRSARINLRYRHDSRYVGVKALMQNRGLVGFEFAFNTVLDSEPFDEERFFRPEQRFIAVATNCLDGTAKYFEKGKCGDIFKAIRASASMPYISKMVSVDGIPCLDGGCSDKLPFKWAYKNGYEKVVLIKTRPDAYRTPIKDKSKLANLVYRSHPSFANVLAKSDENYNKLCDEAELLRQQGKLFVISPSGDVSVGRLEPDMEKLGSLYYMGYNDAKAIMPDLKKYLNI